jgi:hypothetical protein
MSTFVISSFPVPESVFEAIQARLHGLDDDERRFVLHVLVSNVLNHHKVARRGLEGWVEVAQDLPCEWIAEHFGTRLRASNIAPTILTIFPHSTKMHQCRSFMVDGTILRELLTWSPISTEDASEVDVVDLFDGKPYRSPSLKEWDNGVYSSKVVRRAIDSFEGCSFNGAGLDRYLGDFKERVEAASPADRTRLEAMFLNDNSCATRIRAGSDAIGSGIFSYRPAYRTIYTGRIVEIGGGAQSCSRAMKAALFGGVPGVRNYDLRAAQAYILLQELEDASLRREWLTTYLDSKDAGEDRSRALGISKDAYKRCLYATIMGGTHAKRFVRADNSIYDALFRESGGNAERAKELTVDVYNALAPLKSEVDAWHDHLMTAPTCQRLDRTYKKVRTLRNACDQHFKLEGYRADKLARKAAAFILQGQEAAFIHRLTTLGAKHGFTPISNQHDGLVVVGEIPQQAKSTAASASGLRYATLDEKPFVSATSQVTP